MAQPASEKKSRIALRTALLGVFAALAVETANAALINPALGPVVIGETAVVLPGTNPDGSLYIIDNGARLTSAPGGTYGSYSVVNNTTDLDILGFAVSNSASTLTFVLSANNGAWNMTPAQWAQPSMFGSIISVALNQALGPGTGLNYVTPEFVFGSFESNFGTATRANLYYSRQSTSVIGPGTTITDTFFFGPAQFASDFVAFLVPTGALTAGTLDLEDIRIVRGAATVVPLPATAWLLVTGVAALGFRRLRAR